MTVKELYEKDFGTEEKDYDSAIQLLWEDHNKYGQNGNVPSWPPPLEIVEKKVDEIKTGRAYANDRR